MNLLTVSEVARQLRVTGGCVYRMLSVGELPCIRVGRGQGRVRVDQADLDAFLAERREVNLPSTQTRPNRPRLKLKHLKTGR